MKNIYEIFDEFEEAPNKQEKMKVLEKNLSPTLVEVLKLTFHPDIKWKYKALPEEYKTPDFPAGMGYTNLSTEMRRMYLFQEGHPKSLEVSDRRRKELLLQFLESIEPREAEVVAGMFKKDQGVKGLTYKFVKEAFPQMLP